MRNLDDDQVSEVGSSSGLKNTLEVIIGIITKIKVVFDKQFIFFKELSLNS